MHPDRVARHRPQAADYGVVLGCGPMGMWCIQALAGNYLAGLIAIDVDDAKLEMAKGFGATATINSKMRTWWSASGRSLAVTWQTL